MNRSHRPLVPSVGTRPAQAPSQMGLPCTALAHEQHRLSAFDVAALPPVRGFGRRNLSRLIEVDSSSVFKRGSLASRRYLCTLAGRARGKPHTLGEAMRMELE